MTHRAHLLLICIALPLAIYGQDGHQFSKPLSDCSRIQALLDATAQEARKREAERRYHQCVTSFRAASEEAATKARQLEEEERRYEKFIKDYYAREAARKKEAQKAQEEYCSSPAHRHTVYDHVVHAMIKHDHETNVYSIIPHTSLLLFSSDNCFGSSETISSQNNENVRQFCARLKGFFEQRWASTGSVLVKRQGLDKEKTFLLWNKVKSKDYSSTFITSCFHSYDDIQTTH